MSFSKKYYRISEAYHFLKHTIFLKNTIFNMEQKIVMYTDGGSRNNPGPAAIGVYIETLHKQYGHYIGEKTNNEAEYEAVIFGLKKINVFTFT